MSSTVPCDGSNAMAQALPLVHQAEVRNEQPLLDESSRHAGEAAYPSVSMVTADPLLTHEHVFDTWTGPFDWGPYPPQDLDLTLPGGWPMDRLHEQVRETADTLPKAHDLSSTGVSPSKLYPILGPVMPYLHRICSRQMACCLLEVYTSDMAREFRVPASTLLLGHLFRRDTLLCMEKPRKCTPALVCSMLLLATASTESPYFGASRTARGRLLKSLYDITLRLVESPESYVPTDSQASGDHAGCQGRSPCTLKQNILDDVVTYMHMALVSSLPDIDATASRWWHTAFQLAKEGRLNTDIMLDVSNTTQRADLSSTATQATPAALPLGIVSPGDSCKTADDEQPTCDGHVVVDLQDEMVIDRTDYRFLNASAEQLEERRRVWWTLYIWDKQLAVSYNDPITITAAESQETLSPSDDDSWQLPLGDYNSAKAIGNPSRFMSATLNGVATLYDGDNILGGLLPLTTAIEDLTTLRSLSKLQSSDPALYHACKNSYRASIESRVGNAIQCSQDSLTRLRDPSAQLSIPSCTNRFKQLLKLHNLFLARTILALSFSSWDMTSTIAGLMDPNNLTDFMAALQHTIAAAKVLSDVLELDTQLSFKPLFFDAFLFHAASIAYVGATALEHQPSSDLIDACRIYMRVLEASIATTHTECQVCKPLAQVCYPS